MNKKRKTILSLGFGITGLMIVIFLYITLSNIQYRKRIPELNDTQFLSAALKAQIQEAFKSAYRLPSAKNLGELGLVYHSSAHYNEASSCYQLAIKRSKSDWKWNYYIGYLNMELGMPDLVVENFKRVLEINEEADLARYYLGEAYRNLKQYDLAEDAFSKITANPKIHSTSAFSREDNFPLDIYAMFQLSKIYFDRGQPEQAENTLITLLQQNDVYGPAFRLLGNIYKMKGEISQGEEYIIRANDLYLYTPPVDTLIDKISLISRSELYLMKKIDEAVFHGYSDWAFELVEHGLKYIPENKTMLSKAIKVYVGKNMKQKAAGLTERHLNFFLENYDELVTTGNLFFQINMYEVAAEYWTAALSLKSEDADVYKNLAMCFWKMEDPRRAEEVLIKAAEAYRDNPENLAEIILVFLQFEMYDKANRYLKKFNAESASTPKIQKLHGKVAEKNGDLNRAIAMYESSFRGNPRDKETIHFIGDLLVYKKNWRKYIDFYKEVLVYNPNDPEYLEKMSTIYLSCPDKSLRDLDQCIKYSIRAFSHKNSTTEILLTTGKNLALALAGKGDKENATKTMKKTIHISQITHAPENVKQELEQIYRAIQN